MSVIVLANRKGGSGKSSSTAILATIFTNQGKKVICLDADNEVSLIKWHGLGTLNFDVKAVNSETIRSEVKELVTQYDYVIIDLPPNDESILMKACTVADEVIVPLNASPQDLLRLPSTLESIETVEDARGKDLTSVVLVRAKKGTKMLAETRSVLESHNTPLCDTVIHDSVRYQNTTPEYFEEYQALIKELDL